MKFRTRRCAQQAGKGLLGNPAVSGISHSNGDGKDDDAKVEIAVGVAKTCVAITASDIKLSAGAC